MLRSFNDDDLPKVRRSIIIYTIFAFIAYRYQGTIDLTKVAPLGNIESLQEVQIGNFGYATLIAITYLLYRLVHFIPIYQHNINNVFSEHLKDLERKEGAIAEKLDLKLAHLNSINMLQTDKSIAKFDLNRTEVINRIQDLKDTVTDAEKKINDNVDRFVKQIESYKYKLDSVPRGLPEDLPDLDRNSTWQSYKFLRNPLEGIENPFEPLNNVLDRHRTDLSDIQLPSIKPKLKDIETQTQIFLDSDYSLIGEFDDTTKDARKAHNAEANTFTIWVPALVASFGLSLGICLILQLESLWSPLALAFPIAIPTVWFAKNYRPQKD